MNHTELKHFQLNWEKCKIRILAPSDAMDIYNAASDPKIYRTRLKWKKDSYDIDDAQVFIKEAEEFYKWNQKRIFGIEYNGKIVWVTSITKYPFPSENTALFWAWIWVEYQGKGIYKEARTLITNHVKDIFPEITRLEARLFESNKIIPHVLEQLWYVKEATLKNRINFRWKIMDEIIYAKYL